MDATHFKNMLLTSTSLVAENLTDEELNELYLAALLGADPRTHAGYEKAKSLFGLADGTQMHPEMVEAFGKIWQKRLGEKG